MDGKQLRRLRPELNTFLRRSLPVFGRQQNQQHAGRFVQGLLGGQDRRNTENIAEAVEGGVVRTMQKSIARGSWEDGKVLRELRAHLAETLGEERGTINIDETGFAKKGKKSVGVKRQYCGTLGRVDNCQIGVLANYYSSKGHTFIDRRLYLPEKCCRDLPRRDEAGVPENIVFRTKTGGETQRRANCCTCRRNFPVRTRRSPSPHTNNATTAVLARQYPTAAASKLTSRSQSSSTQAAWKYTFECRTPPTPHRRG